ncbi:MAG: hypothetical protein PHQ43_13245 [Dehalococcoidales bacterium]|nr:hypothetical protein [Dehalococcoidales bacterium]
MTIAELKAQDWLRPCDLKRFGKRVKIFKTEPKLCEDWHDAHRRTRIEVWQYLQQHGGQVYTGTHSESDHTKECQWDSGWHIANRTGNYAVITAV